MTTIATFDFAQVLPGGFRMPARMTALPLEGGGVALVSPIPLTADVIAAVSAVGPVRFLIAPNLLHHLYLAAASEQWPDARVLAPRGLTLKRPDLRIDGFLEDGLPAEVAATTRGLKIEGAPSVDEHVFFHEPSRTLVVTDLLFNVTRPEGLVANVVLWLVGCRGRLAQSRTWRLFVKDRARAAKSARALLALPFDAAVVAHGDRIASGAHAPFARALAWMVSGDALAAPAPTSRPSKSA